MMNNVISNHMMNKYRQIKTWVIFKPRFDPAPGTGGCVCEHTETFGGYSTALQRVNGPVVVFQSVHELQDGADAADGAVDGGGADELRGQVRVEGQLDLRVHVHPQSGKAADLGRHTATGCWHTSSAPGFLICAALSQACSVWCWFWSLKWCSTAAASCAALTFKKDALKCSFPSFSTSAVLPVFN